MDGQNESRQIYRMTERTMDGWMYKDRMMARQNDRTIGGWIDGWSNDKTIFRWMDWDGRMVE